MSILFEAKKIGKMEVGNRFVRSATYEAAAGEAGQVTDAILDMYRKLSKGGIGLVITGHTYVQPNGQAGPKQLGIHRDDLVPGLRQLTDEVHRANPDCRIAIQISHAGRQVSPMIVIDPVAPSAVTDTATSMTPREITEAEIEECIKFFADAGERAKLAGFDAMELHSAHGFLISSFNSPHTNLRTDRWGGRLEDRMRFLMEAYRAVRKKVGDDYPILVKLNGEDFVDDGIEIDESAQIAKALAVEGVDAIEVSGGMYESHRGKNAVRSRIRKPEQEAYFLPHAVEMKKVVGDVPIIAVGGIRSVPVMESIIREGKADFISMSRPFIREPDLPIKIREGKGKADCISCNGCMSSRVDAVRCVQIHK